MKKDNRQLNFHYLIQLFKYLQTFDPLTQTQQIKQQEDFFLAPTKMKTERIVLAKDFSIKNFIKEKY
jgi:hypothetical protein